MNKAQAFCRDLSPYKSKMVSRALSALADDVGDGDITSASTVRKLMADAVVKAKSQCVLCGLVEVEALMKRGKVKVKTLKDEGDSLKPGDVIMTLRGDIKELLKRERTCVNYLQRLSGIATQARAMCSKHPGRIATLRKVAPGLLFSEKRAVEVGGGLTHRVNLGDGFLIKDNHVASVVVEKFKGDFCEENKILAMWECLNRAKNYRRRMRKGWPIEIEVESLTQALGVVEYFKLNGVPDMILLDNFKPEALKRVVSRIRAEVGGRILLEGSGGIGPDNVDEYLASGVDVISTSYLTLGASPADISLKIVGYK